MLKFVLEFQVGSVLKVIVQISCCCNQVIQGYKDVMKETEVAEARNI